MASHNEKDVADGMDEDKVENAITQFVGNVKTKTAHNVQTNSVALPQNGVKGNVIYET